jgi:hypothetical protein
MCQSETTTDKLFFTMSDTKEVLYNQSSKKLDQIYQYVSDKGHWCKVIGQQKELKIGLFYVQMPDNSSNSSSALSTTANSFIHIRSPPPLPQNTKIFKKKKNNLTNILGNNTSISSTTTPSMVTTTTTTTTASSMTLEKPPLRRAKSSLVDLNIEELSDVLKKLNIFSSTPPATATAAAGRKQDTRSYHQIGKGSSKYTFYFEISHVDHCKRSLLMDTRRIKKPFLSYTFLTKYTLLPTASFSSTRKSMPITSPSSHYYPLNTSLLEQDTHCYYLRGHLVDIQDWLDHQKYIQLNYILMDTRTKEMMAQHNISLENIAYDNRGLLDKTVMMMNEDNEQLAEITFKIGLVSGWMDIQQQDQAIVGNKRNTTLSLNQHKKQKPSTSNATSSTSNNRKSISSSIPSIQYIQPRLLKSTKSIIF